MPLQGGAPTAWERREEMKKLVISSGNIVTTLSKGAKRFRVTAAGMKILHLEAEDGSGEQLSVYKKDCLKQ